MKAYAVLLMDNSVRYVHAIDAAGALLAVGTFSKGVAPYHRFGNV
jgi:DNA-binding transcriptional MocR family regulator